MGILIVTPLLLTLSHTIKHSKFQIKRDILEIFNWVRYDSAFANFRSQITNFPGVLHSSQNRYISNFNCRFLIINYLEVAIWLILLLSVSWLVFNSKTDATSALYPLEYLPFPLIVWAALRFRPQGAIFAYSIVSYIAILGTVEGCGPFLVKTENLQQAVLLLQAFTGTIAIMALMLAAAVAERQQALVEVHRTALMLRDREASLANAQHIAQLGNWDLDYPASEPTCNCEQFREQDRPQIELRWSDELYRLLGFVPGRVKPTPAVFLQAVHPEDRELVARSHRQAMFERKPYCIDYRIVLPNGSERIVCEQSAINSNVIAATVQDVTDRQRAARALRASVERDRLLSEMALRIRQSLDLEAILNTTVAEVRQFFKADRAFIGIMDADGAMQTGQVYGRIVAESVGSQCPSVLGWVLTDESHLEHLRTFYAAHRVRAVCDTASVQVCDAVAKYYSDYQIRATLNVPIVLGDELFGLLAVNQCSGPRQWQEFEIDLLEKLATQVAIALQQAQLLQQVKVLNANLESQVEERTHQLQQKMYELQESNRLKDLFLYAVSHNLRTPVMGMLILLKNLLNKSSCESQEAVPVARSILQRIIQASEHQLGMVNSLLDAHASEVKGIFLNTVPLDLPSLISTIVAELEPLLVKNQATLIQQIPADLPQVNADSKYLQRVLDNLLTNAVKHNPPGVNVTFSAEVIEVEKLMLIEDDRQNLSSNNPQAKCIANLISSSGNQTQMLDASLKSPLQPIENRVKNQAMRTKIHLDHNYKLPRYGGQIGNTGDQLSIGRSTVKMVKCTIADNGAGINEQQRESLFELYVQDPNSRPLTGLGLGLYLSKQIVKAHGGEIGFETTPGGGSTFWFCLPVLEI